MKCTNTIIIGGGQAGLAMSRCLADRGIDHVVFERGRVGQRWRSERWDSLRLLTPNWQLRLPGYSYQGSDPTGYMTMGELIDYLEGYARSFSAPVQDETSVLSVRRWDGGYKIITNRGPWCASNVVIATGYCDIPRVPGFGAALSADIEQVVPSRYRNPGQLPDGGVLVVGASATGVQLADEIHRSGRQVTLAVGAHTRLPRLYRGRDIMGWLDAMGTLDQRTEDVRNLQRSRKQPSLQLVGRPDHSTLDLGVLQRAGVKLVGRAFGAAGDQVGFADNLAEVVGRADRKLDRLLARVDSFIGDHDLSGQVETAPAIERIAVSSSPTALDLRAQGIRTVVWATGFRRSYPWLRVPVLDRRGELLHRGGVTPSPGLYALGLNFMRRRKSTYIDGVGSDAEELATHLANTRLENEGYYAAA
jgi:putative flavoprotein involved in K+ transport